MESQQVSMTAECLLPSSSKWVLCHLDAAALELLLHQLREKRELHIEVMPDAVVLTLVEIIQSVTNRQGERAK